MDGADRNKNGGKSLRVCVVVGVVKQVPTVGLSVVRVPGWYGRRCHAGCVGGPQNEWRHSTIISCVHVVQCW